MIISSWHILKYVILKYHKINAISPSVCARGLDVKKLVLVVNYDCPNHYEDYVHRYLIFLCIAPTRFFLALLWYLSKTKLDWVHKWYKVDSKCQSVQFTINSILNLRLVDFTLKWDQKVGNWDLGIAVRSSFSAKCCHFLSCNIGGGLVISLCTLCTESAAQGGRGTRGSPSPSSPRSRWWWRYSWRPGCQLLEYKLCCKISWRGGCWICEYKLCYILTRDISGLVQWRRNKSPRAFWVSGASGAEKKTYHNPSALSLHPHPGKKSIPLNICPLESTRDVWGLQAENGPGQLLSIRQANVA